MKYSITAYDKAENELKRRREAVMNEHEVHAQEIAPVSYTHLTLPTKLEV